jgi:hypothetical protein
MEHGSSTRIADGPDSFSETGGHAGDGQQINELTDGVDQPLAPDGPQSQAQLDSRGIRFDRSQSYRPGDVRSSSTRGEHKG